mgnify:CR=1 FL=1
MKEYAKLFGPVLAVILIGSAAIVFGQTKEAPGYGSPPEPGGRRGPRPGPRFEPGSLDREALEKLNLTDFQKSQVRALMDIGRLGSEAHFEKLRAADEQLRNLMEQPTFNEDQARQILAAKAAASTELEMVRLRTDAAIRTFLTAEQKTKLKEIQATRAPFPSGERWHGPPPLQN